MNTPTISKNAAINFMLFVTLAFLWSGSFINIKTVVDDLPPLFSAMIRVFVSLSCLSVLFLCMRKKVFLPPSKFWLIWVAGICAQALPFAFLFYGEKFIAPALASILNSTVSFWALLLGAFLFRDVSQFTPLKIIGLFAGFAGIALVFFPLLHSGENTIIGILSITGMALAYAIGSLINQHLIFKKMKVTFEINLLQQHIASVLFLFACSFTLETWPAASSLLNSKVIFAFLYLGILATAIAWMIYFYLLKEWGTVRASSVMYIVPVLAIVWDLVFLHLIPTQNEIIGTVAILIGVTLIQFSRKPKPIFSELQKNSAIVQVVSDSEKIKQTERV